MKEKEIIKYKTKKNANKESFIMCQNSIPNGKYWKGNLCDEWVKVNENALGALCHHCVNALVGAPEIRQETPKSDKPKGWKFMKEFIDKDGNVYLKGIEQPLLKGTLPVTVIQAKEPKKKISKQEKETAINALGQEIKSLKHLLFQEQRKGKRVELTRQLTKANRELKKLM